MLKTLEQKLVVEKELKGEMFPAKTIAESKLLAMNYARGGGLVSPMPSLLKMFPHKQSLSVNSEEHVGIDKHGLYVRKGGFVVITLHGGIDSGGILTPNVLEVAADIFRHSYSGGLTSHFGVDYQTVFPEQDVISNLLLHQTLPDGSKIPVISYDVLKHNDYSDTFQSYAVVRSLGLAQSVRTGLYDLNQLVNKNGVVNNSQLIVQAGGVRGAQNLLNRIQASNPDQRLGIYNLFEFNSDLDPTRPQGFSLNLGKFNSSHNILTSKGNFVAISKDAVDLYFRE